MIMKLITGSSNPDLGRNIAAQLNLPLIETELSQFANGEKRVWIKTPVRGENIVLVQSFSAPVDEHIMEFLLLVDALERLGARHINAVIPWLGYSLQDKVFRDGEPIAAKVVADLVSHSYVKRVFFMDLHNSSTPGFFSIPTSHLSALSPFVDYVKNTFDLTNTVVASPDFGGLKRSRVFADQLGLDLVNIDKHRDLHTGQPEAVDVHGDVQDKTVLVFDDCILSGGTVVEASDILKARGARQVHFLATHGLFCNDAQQRLQNSSVDSVVATNSIQQTTLFEKLKIVDVANEFALELQNWL
jgi:ribose-phosphate pyrophosphokinase